MENFSIRKMWYQNDMCNYLKSIQPIRLLTQMPGNIGDHLIWAGTKELLVSNGINFTEISRTDIEDADARVNSNETLLIPGSGAFTYFFHEWLPSLTIRASKLFKKVVILPSEYDVSVPVVLDALNQSNVYPFAREDISYRKIKCFGRFALSFDPALYYFNSLVKVMHKADIKSDLSNLLVAMRTDKLSLLHLNKCSPNHQINNDISLTSKNLTVFVQYIQQSEVIVTDRLHVAVCAAMFGKTLIYFDPGESKISTYFKFHFRDELNHYVSQCDINWLIKNNLIVKV